MKITSYLNFDGKTEEAFTLYKKVFGGEFISFQRFSDVPQNEDQPIAEEEKDNVMHVTLKINDTIELMGSDISPSMGHTLQMGNNVYISLHPDSKEEAQRLYDALSKDGKVEMELAEMFWGALYASFTDKYGVCWMINYDLEKK